ncbi:hypothetical protein [Oscillatoria acuminata]|uniref:Uncharacterized protein n=1 Tax=Oscillatoria acuminata PCC 6304 TaxID=56110 RepID=K9TKT4_9CYAN|nr:hypothetical protein [Oscillatoria acuminata]AFY83150.1 hypothetical protein Oscil6304_3587 [Oscillatoria acuminata PCC 6304]
MSIPSEVLAKLKILETLYQQGKSNEVINQTLDKIINQELAESRQKNQELEAEIQRFEQQYQMSSAEFYQRFHSGELGDEIDWVEWNAFYHQMWMTLQEQIKLLQSTDNL